MQCIHSDFNLAISMKGSTFTAVIFGKYLPLLSSFTIFQIVSESFITFTNNCRTSAYSFSGNYSFFESVKLSNSCRIPFTLKHVLKNQILSSLAEETMQGRKLCKNSNQQVAFTPKLKTISEV